MGGPARIVMIAACFVGGADAAHAQTPAQEDRPTSEIADSWIGKDASELLLQWPVDAGFQQTEDEKPAKRSTPIILAQTLTAMTTRFMGSNIWSE